MKLELVVATGLFLAGSTVIDPTDPAHWALLIQPGLAAWIATTQHRIKTLEKELDRLRSRVHMISNVTTTLAARCAVEHDLPDINPKDL